MFCSSVLGLIAAPYRGSYSASKFAVEALHSHGVAGSGIYVSLIEPGPIATRFVERAIEAYRRNVDLEACPSRYLSRPHRQHGGRRSDDLQARSEAVAGKLVHALESPHQISLLPPFPPTPWRYCGLLPAVALDAVAKRN